MKQERYNEIEYKNERLIKEEIDQGWHFCGDWDFLLIHITWPEYEECTCKK